MERKNALRFPFHRPVAVRSFSAIPQALLVMDVQKDFTGEDARMPVEKEQIPKMLEAIGRLEREYSQMGNYVIYIRNVFSKRSLLNLFRHNAAVEGSEGIELDSRLLRVSDIVFDKSVPDAFTSREFESFLKEHSIEELTVCGVFADQCVYRTSLSALDRGYAVNFVLNAVAAGDLRAVRRAARKLQEKGARIITC